MFLLILGIFFSQKFITEQFSCNFCRENLLSTLLIVSLDLQNFTIFQSEQNNLNLIFDIFWSAFFGPEYLSVFSPNEEKSGKNVDQNNSEYGLFLRSIDLTEEAVVW